MFYPDSPVKAGDHHYRNSDGVFRTVVIPDLLISSNHRLIAIASSDVLYFSKDDHRCRVYCENHKMYISDHSIQKMWLNALSIPSFKKIGSSMIINQDKIVSVKKNGQKLILLSNGDELQVDNDELDYILSGNPVV